eukprot:jgi/Chrzof1/12337/Cz06g31010.t1
MIDYARLKNVPGSPSTGPDPLAVTGVVLGAAGLAAQAATGLKQLFTDSGALGNALRQELQDQLRGDDEDDLPLDDNKLHVSWDVLTRVPLVNNLDGMAIGLKENLYVQGNRKICRCSAADFQYYADTDNYRFASLPPPTEDVVIDMASKTAYLYALDCTQVAGIGDTQRTIGLKIDADATLTLNGHEFVDPAGNMYLGGGIHQFDVSGARSVYLSGDKVYDSNGYWLKRVSACNVLLPTTSCNVAEVVGGLSNNAVALSNDLYTLSNDLYSILALQYWDRITTSNAIGQVGTSVSGLSNLLLSSSLSTFRLGGWLTIAPDGIYAQNQLVLDAYAAKIPSERISGDLQRIADGNMVDTAPPAPPAAAWTDYDLFSHPLFLAQQAANV